MQPQAKKKQGQVTSILESSNKKFGWDWEGWNSQVMERVFSKVRIGLNESQDRNCSSKQIQLPEALHQKETNELYAQGYLVFCLVSSLGFKQTLNELTKSTDNLRDQKCD